MGLPLVLLPGLMCDRVVWSATMDALSADTTAIVPAYGDIASLAGMADLVLALAPLVALHLAWIGPITVNSNYCPGRLIFDIPTLPSSAQHGQEGKGPLTPEPSRTRPKGRLVRSRLDQMRGRQAKLGRTPA